MEWDIGMGYWNGIMGWKMGMQNRDGLGYFL
jgi:hypothetical protein